MSELFASLEAAIAQARETMEQAIEGMRLARAEVERLRKDNDALCAEVARLRRERLNALAIVPQAEA